jgi:diacylglycerol kinase family enzyme
MDPSPLWLIVNAASGSNSDEAVAALTQAFARAGRDPARIVRFPDEDLPTRAVLEQAGVGVLAIFTGDGTINAQVALVHGWEGSVLILPGGTQNLLAKELHGETDATAIVQKFGAGQMERGHCHAVETSQGHALVEVVAGPAVTWAEVREGMRTMDLGSIAEALAGAVRETAAGAPVYVAEPAMGRPEGYRAVRIDASSGVLDLDGYDAADFAELAAHANNMIVRRDFRDGPHENLGTAARVTCRSEAAIALMIDGERREGAQAETFACVTLPVHFLRSLARPRD